MGEPTSKLIERASIYVVEIDLETINLGEMIAAQAARIEKLEGALNDVVEASGYGHGARKCGEIAIAALVGSGNAVSRGDE